MAFKKTPREFPGSTFPVSGSQGKAFSQDPDTDNIVSGSVQRGEGNIPFSGHDLVADGDFVIPDDVSSLSNPPFIGGGTQSVLGVESTDSNQFSIKFEYGALDSNGNFQTRFTYDSTDNAKLDGDTAYVILINVILDRVKVTISDTSSAGTNTIQGGLNSH